MKITDLMIDFETYGVKHDAAPLQLAAVPFNLKEGKLIDMKPFNRYIDFMDAIAQGCTVSTSTMEWWEEQEEQLKIKTLSGKESLSYVLHAFNSYFIDCDRGNEINIWCHTIFDAPILMNAFDLCGIKPNFRFWQFKDLRTAQLMTGTVTRPEFVGEKHNALDDCYHQIECLVHWIKEAKKWYC